MKLEKIFIGMDRFFDKIGVKNKFAMNNDGPEKVVSRLIKEYDCCRNKQCQKIGNEHYFRVQCW